ncbi:RluA family pseudouridine synthase [Desulfovibrio sp. ZJ369]|uniref:RluA family pseudouridine synthase n=1 Tax=Desulfovibrio sp. ZJ369 TaxID=2709793 RepID=UPI0013E9B6B1|nr:RluA family pseudouridine synthase [Desulfovibrio sp. ZJ369]
MPSDDTSAPAPDPASSIAVTDSPVVSEAESGQKLLQFLQRRLNLPPALLHRWVRTGQIRINGGRCKPFARVRRDDVIRLPPFALKMAAQSNGSAERDLAGRTLLPERMAFPVAAPSASLPPLPVIVRAEGPIWAVFKPAGLPTHPGTGHSDSLATRLAAHHAGAIFKPTPAHRLDKETSGILLVAASFEALREIQQAMRERAVIKEYVAWVRGRWPYAETRLLRHHLRKSFERGYEKMRAVKSSDSDHSAREALCLARPLRVQEQESLLLIRLLTGRTHQIRVQLASLGHPVLGDAKYGMPEDSAAGRMYLHALRIVLPRGEAFACLPEWPGRRALHALPDCLDLSGSAEYPQVPDAGLSFERG